MSSRKAKGPPGRRTRVLTVLPDLPLPIDTGLHHRMVGNLKVVEHAGAESHLLAFGCEERQGSLAHVTEIQGMVESFTFGGMRQHDSAFTPFEKAAGKLRYLSTGLLPRTLKTYPFAARYDAINGVRLAVAEARRLNVDFVIIPSFLLHWAPAFRSINVEVIADAIDIQTDLTRRLLDQVPATQPAAKASLTANYLATRSQERRFFPLCREVWVTSTGEAKRAHSLWPGVNTVVVPNTIESPPVTGNPGPIPMSIGFLGTYSSSPNLAAAESLVREIFPRVLREMPGASLRIAGAGLPEHLREDYTSRPGVQVLGRVESSARFISECDIMALPITVRGGVPLKLVESFALRRPVVASREMVAGLDLRAGTDLLVCDDVDSFAQGILELLRDPELRHQMTKDALEVFRRDFCRETAMAHVARQTAIAGTSNRVSQ